MPSYAEERDANMARNRQILKLLEVDKLRPKIEPKETRHRKQKTTRPTTGAVGHKRKVTSEDSDTDVGEQPSAKRSARVTRGGDALVQPGKATEGRRRSSRIAGKPVDAMVRVEQSRGAPQPISVKSLVLEPSGKVTRERRYNPKTYGSIPGIEVGSWWASREECSNDAIHAPWVGGIAPGPNGAYSIALSGGYDDDVDDGYAFTYTGAGMLSCGRDLKGTKAAPKNLRTAEQSFDQSFEHNHNKSLKRSVETGNPVRVIRGFKLRSKYGPSEGYRYDGLYVVKKYWQETGLNAGGFLVCKFAFVRLPDQSPIPVKGVDEEDDEMESTAGDDNGSDAEGHSS